MGIDWILVTDRLPDKNKEILVYSDKPSWPKYWVGYYDSQWYGGYNCYLLANVSHWAELSPPLVGVSRD